MRGGAGHAGAEDAAQIDAGAGHAGAEDASEIDAEQDMVELKTRGEIDAMGAAGRVVADALAAVRAHAAVGVTLASLDQVARDVLADAGAGSPFLGYQPGFAGSPFQIGRASCRERV